MRIIAGTWRGRELVAPKGRGTRPTSDRVREALFSILGDVAGLEVLDLFAGSGALGLEALSRGARSAVFVEDSRPAIAALRRNVAALSPGDRVRVVAADARAALRRLGGDGARFHLAFLDPPYAAGAAAGALDALVGRGVLAPGAWVVLEHATRDAAPAAPEGLTLRFTRRYGDTALTFYRCATEAT